MKKSMLFSKVFQTTTWLFLSACLLISSGVLAASNNAVEEDKMLVEICENFDAGLGNWNDAGSSIMIMSTNTAPSSNGTNYLRAYDESGNSYATSPAPKLDYACAQICFDYKVFNDGWSSNNPGHVDDEPVQPRFIIFSGASIDAPTLSATFLAPFVSENDPWDRICVGLADLATPPEGWTMTTGAPTDWPMLLANISGFGFTTDVAVGPTANEIIGVDDFCIITADDALGDANYTLDGVDYDTDHYSLLATNYDLFAGYNPVHEWFIFSSPNQFAGPYTPIAMVEGEDFYYEPVDYQVFNYVTHRVTTDCGEYCFTTYENNGGREKEIGRGGNDWDPYDCGILEDVFPLCKLGGTITGLSTQNGQFSWTPVLGADSYSIFIEFGANTSCLCPNEPPTQLIYLTENSFLDIPDALYSECFEWYVVARCEGGEQITSAPACFYPIWLEGDGATDRAIEVETNQWSTPKDIKVYPNPVVDQLHFTVSEKNFGINGFQVELLNTAGQVLQSVSYAAGTHDGRLDVATYPRACYLLRFFDEAGNSHYQKVILTK